MPGLAVAALLAAQALTGCGGLHALTPVGKKSSASGGGDATAAGGPPQTYSFTASYSQRPVDFFIIRDGATRQEPFNTRIDEATLVLAARLWNLGSVHVGVFDHFFPPPQTPVPGQPAPPPAPPGPTSATPLIDKAHPAAVLDAAAMTAAEFSDAVATRVGDAGNRGGTYLPAATLMDLLATSQRASGSTVGGLFRPEAFWAVLYIGSTLNPPDPYDVSDVMAAFKGHSGSFLVSALTLDDKGCVIVGTNPPQIINKEKAPQRNLEVKLQQATTGIFGSICTNSTFALFADDVVNKGTGTDYFTVALPAVVKGSTIQVSVHGTPIPEFRYTEGSATLEVSTLVTNGEAFQVSAVPVGPPPVVDVNTAPNVDHVPQAGESKASPAELAFLTNVQPSISAVCGPCHSGRPFNTDKGYAAALQFKGQIATNLALPLANGMHMPLGIDLKGTNPAAFQAINTWATQP